MSIKKGMSFGFSFILGIVGLMAIIFVLAIATGAGPRVKKFVEGIVKEASVSDEERDCRSQMNSFWCQGALDNNRNPKPRCLTAQERGVEGNKCNPKNYKPAYPTPKEKKYDTCAEQCEVRFCPAGTGRIDNKCVACRKDGEDCQGVGPFYKGECCAPERYECASTGNILNKLNGIGACKPKAAYTR